MYKPVYHPFFPAQSAVFWKTIKKVFYLQKWQKRKPMHKCGWRNQRTFTHIQFPFLTHLSEPQIRHEILALLSPAKSKIAFNAPCAPCFYTTGFSKWENGNAQSRELNTKKIKWWSTKTLKEIMDLNITIASIIILTKETR